MLILGIMLKLSVAIDIVLNMLVYGGSILPSPAFQIGLRLNRIYEDSSSFPLELPFYCVYLLSLNAPAQALVHPHLLWPASDAISSKGLVEEQLSNQFTSYVTLEERCY